MHFHSAPTENKLKTNLHMTEKKTLEIENILKQYFQILNIWQMSYNIKLKKSSGK